MELTNKREMYEFSNTIEGVTISGEVQIGEAKNILSLNGTVKDSEGETVGYASFSEDAEGISSHSINGTTAENAEPVCHLMFDTVNAIKDLIKD